MTCPVGCGKGKPGTVHVVIQGFVYHGVWKRTCPAGCGKDKPGTVHVVIQGFVNHGVWKRTCPAGCLTAALSTGIIPLRADLFSMPTHSDIYTHARTRAHTLTLDPSVNLCESRAVCLLWLSYIVIGLHTFNVWFTYMVLCGLHTWSLLNVQHCTFPS